MIVSKSITTEAIVSKAIKNFSLIFVYLRNAIEMRHQPQKIFQCICGGGDGHCRTNQMTVVMLKFIAPLSS